jgi:hypothetical protein
MKRSMGITIRKVIIITDASATRLGLPWNNLFSGRFRGNMREARRTEMKRVWMNGKTIRKARESEKKSTASRKRRSPHLDDSITLLPEGVNPELLFSFH